MSRVFHCFTVVSVAVGAIVSLTAGVQAAPGTLDARFGNGGRVMLSAPTFVSRGVHALVRQPDGKLVGAGGSGGFALARFLSDGTLDASFGTAGLVSTDGFPGCCNEGVTALALQPDGKIVAAGGTYAAGYLARYQADGTLDAAFGSGGMVSVSAGMQQYSYATVALTADGKILAGGSGGVRRYLADGSPDPSFAGGGAVNVVWYAGSVAVQPDGRIVVAGATVGGVPTLARHAADGTLDPSFGSGGTAALGEVATAVVLLPDGRIVVAGTSSSRRFVLERFQPDGALDPSFGTGGMAAPALPAVDARALALAAQDDGRLVAAGWGRRGVLPDTDFFVVRYLESGDLDPSFGDGGSMATDFASVEDEGHALALVPDGTIVVAGSAGSEISGAMSIGLARYLGGTCGDGVVDGGEDCDDGNLIGGDGCDAHCCLADADGDGVCDARDPCSSSLVATRAKIVVARLASEFVADDRLALSGRFVVPGALVPSLDPATHGIRLIIDDAHRNALDVTIPGGAFVDPPGTGWKAAASGARWTWLQRIGTNLPGGISKLAVSVRGTEVKVAVTGRGRSYRMLANALPLTATIVLDATSGCAALSFPGPPPAPACAFNSAGGTIRCR